MSGRSHAQQRERQVIGFLSGGAASAFAPQVAAFSEGLRGAGFVEGQNVTTEYRWAEGAYDRLPALAQDLVQRNASVIVTSGGDLAARAAKAATSRIPIIFTSGDDPTVTGLVTSYSRPGGNLTGVGLMLVELHPKRLEILAEVISDLRVVALLVNPASPQTERVIKLMREAVSGRPLQLNVFEARNAAEIQSAFDGMGAARVNAVVVQADPFFVSRREQIVELAHARRLPAIYEGRPFVGAGGLMSYGASSIAVYRQLGAYAGRVLRGEKPGDLPVMQPERFELVVNQKAARALDLALPETFISRADEVIGD